MNVSKIIQLRDGETVLRVARNFWLTVAHRLAAALFLVAGALFFMYPLLRLDLPGLAVFLFLLLLGLYYGGRTLVVWRWNVFIVTDRRLVDVDQRGLFRRGVTEAAYDKVRDITYSVNGLRRTLLGYGSVRVETDGSFLEIPAVRRPRDIHHLITEAAGRYRASGGGGAQSDRVAELLATASQLNDAEAKAFLVAIQQAVTQGRPAGDAVAAERRKAAEEWASAPEGRAGGGVFREDVIEG